MSRLNVKDSSTYGNVNTHVFTEFSTLNKEDTQKQVLQAIKDINISAEIGQIIVESSDTITHEKLDVINATIDNKHLNSGFDSVEIGSVAGDLVITTTVDNFPGSFAINNFPLVQEVNGTVNVSNAFSTEDTLLTTNDKLDTINTTITDKHLNSSLDSVNVNKVVESVFYNLDYVGSQMYADSINGAVIDEYGRPGWLWGNEATTGGSNCYWYSNSIVPQNQMTKAQMDCVYVILALDRVQPDIVLPFIPMYSAPTGSGDIIPGFAHSSWTYTIPATHILNAGEVIMLTIGDHTKVDNIRPELRRVHLELNSTNGQALPTENIAYISLNTDSGLKPIGAIRYLLQNAGFHYSVNNKITDYEFNNGVQKYINDNLTTQGIKIRGDVNVTGTVNIGNFPTSFEVNNFPSSYAVSSLPSVEINNFPTSFEVSNFPSSYAVSSLPSIEITNTGFNVNNFPTSFEVSNTVSVYDSNTEAINQKLTNASAPNNDCIKVFQANNPTSIEVSNFPTSTEVSNFPTSTEVSNFPTSTEVSNFPTSTEVSNFPTSTEVSNTVTVYNTDIEAINQKLNNATAPNNDCIKVFQANNPTSIEVSNFPATQPVSISGTVPVSGTFWQNTQPISGSISNSFTLDTTTQSTNTKLDTIHNDLDGLTFDGSSNLNVKVNNASIPVTGTFWQNTQPVSISGTVPVSGTFWQNTQPISGSISNSFTLDTTTQSTNTKLDTIHNDLDGLTFDGSSNLNVIVNNASIPVTGTFWQNTQPISGSISNSFTLDTTTQSTNTKLDTIHNDLDGLTYDGSSNLNVNVVSGSITVSSVNIKDSSGNNLNSTSNALNSYITNTSVDTHCYASSNGTNWHHLKSDSNGILNTHSMVQDGAGTDITSTLNGAKQSLDVNVSNTVPVSGSFYPATQPISGTVGISGTVPVSGSFYQATQPVSIAGTVAVSGSFYQTVQPVSGSVTVSNTIPVTGYVDAYLKDGAGNAISSTSSAINSYLTNTNTTNNIITGAGSGLSMYVIPSKTKTFLFNAYSGSSAANAAIGAVSNTQTFSGSNWGIANPRNTWTVVRTGLTASAVFNYTYVDGSGNETVGTPITLSTTSPFALANGIVTVNSWYINATLGTGDSINVSSTSNVNASWGSGSYLQQNNSLWTCPNNCIAWVANVAYYSSTADALRLFKWDAAGNRTIMYGWYNASNFTSSASGEYGFGGYIKAGETIGWGGEGSNIISRVLHSNIVCKYL